MPAWLRHATGALGHLATPLGEHDRAADVASLGIGITDAASAIVLSRRGEADAAEYAEFAAAAGAQS